MKKKIVFIGNSIVNGYPFSRGRSFPGIVRTGLKEGTPADEFSRRGFGFDVINKGVDGETITGIMERLDRDVIAHNPDLVFVLTGTNDFIYRENTPEEAFAGLKEIKKRLGETHPNATLVYMTPLPIDAAKAEAMWLVGLGIAYGAVRKQLDMLSDIIRNSGEHFVDTNRLYAEYIAGLDDPETAYVDGIHPQQQGQQFIADCVLNWMRENY